MKRITNFLKSILPILLVLALQIAVTLVMGVVYALTSDGSFSEVMDGIFGTSATVVGYPQLTNVVYGILALILFTAWYRGVFVRPNKDKKKADYPSGFSFHTIVAILFLGIGMYYVTSLVVDVTAAVFPEGMSGYSAMIQESGYTSPSLLLILYTVILAPIVEELAFRGLAFRYARQAMPFWMANIWQALLFGLLHFNLIQGIYAFVMGLFLGFVIHRGRGVKYSILVHIVFNVIGLWFSELVALTLDLNYAIAMLCGIALTIFAVWLYYTDFTPAEQKREKKRKNRR